ncbi:MAG: oxidoreductase [Citricoccus sp.]|jgi:predicted dehydrogenase|nr:oxidoreductase [Citricoccus sp. WCRC_4]
MGIPTENALRPTLRVAVVGADSGTPGLARGFAQSTDWELLAVCDADRSLAERLARETGHPAVTTSVTELLAGHDVDAVVIATPAHTHHEIALQALAAGKHVLLEKPLADTTGAAVEIVTAAESRGSVLMVNHAYCYTPAVLKIRELIAGGELGEIRYVDSVRINHDFVRSDADVFWDQAAHDLSVLDFVLPGGLEPQVVSAQGADPLRSGKACVGYLNVPLSNGALAHVHVNWLSPTKVQQMVIGGSRKTLVWDDLNPQQRLSIFDRDAVPDRRHLGLAEARTGPGAAVPSRLQDPWSPPLGESTPLALMVSNFADAIRGHRPALTDGRSALRVLSVLESTSTSLARGGATTPIADPWAPAHGPSGAADAAADARERTGRGGT